MRFLGLASIAGIVIVAGMAGAITLRGGDAASVTETSAGNVGLRQEGKVQPRTQHMPRPLTPTPVRASTVVAPVDSDSTTVTVTPASAAPTPGAPTPGAPTPAAPAPVSPTPAVSAPVARVIPPSSTGLLLGQGRTTLTDSIYAVRSGDSVTVNFDTMGNRTGRADKFEAMVRNTLPLVYGRRNTASIDSIPQGSLLPSRDVLGELTTRGMHLRLDNGTAIAVWPRTRETSSGPLVVEYLIVVER